MTPDDAWRDRAACRSHIGPAPMPWDFDAHEDDLAYAVDTCWNRCPVQDQCAEWARNAGPDGGVWGGVLIKGRR